MHFNTRGNFQTCQNSRPWEGWEEGTGKGRQLLHAQLYPLAEKTVSQTGGEGGVRLFSVTGIGENQGIGGYRRRRQ